MGAIGGGIAFSIGLSIGYGGGLWGPYWVFSEDMARSGLLEGGGKGPSGAGDAEGG